MAKNKVSEYSSTAASNTDIGNININEGCAPSNINNAIRELMAQIKDFQQGADGDGLTVSTLNATTATVGSLSATSFGAITATSANISGALTTATAAITTATITNVQVADGTAAAPSITKTGDTNTGVFFPAADTVGISTGGVEQFRVASDGQLSAVVPSGSTLYPSYTARAWVNFDGTGTPAIRASGNVSSITDSGVGLYVVNFTTAMPDTNYATVTGSISRAPILVSNTSKTTSAVSIDSYEQINTSPVSYGEFDQSEINVAVFR